MRIVTLLIAILIMFAIPCEVNAGTVTYKDNNFENNFIPLGDDGAAGRPIPGDHLGNQITLAPNTGRLLTAASVMFGLNNDGSVPLISTLDTYVASIYKNDGVGGQPGTLIGSSSVAVQDDVQFNVTFSFADLLVPDSFTFVLSSSHTTDSWSSEAGLVGPMSTFDSPDIGSGINSLWSNTNSGLTSWTANSTWALDDGASTNFFNMALTTEQATTVVVPLPASLLPGLTLGASVFLGSYIRNRTGKRPKLF